MRSLALGQVLLVGFGGFVGSMLCCLVRGWAHRAVPFAQLRWGEVVEIRFHRGGEPADEKERRG